MSIGLAVFISYIVGSIVTGLMAYKAGVIRGSGATVDMLVAANFVKWRRVNGEIELQPLGKDD
jgi:hypothetical protein